MQRADSENMARYAAEQKLVSLDKDMMLFKQHQNDLMQKYTNEIKSVR